MKKILLTSLILVSFFGLANAQGKMSLGGGLIVSLPMGNFADAANTGFGGSADFEMSFTPNITGTGQIGYLYWGTDVDNVSWSGVPVLVGIKYYFTPGVKFYGIGQLGLTFFTYDYKYNEFGVNYSGSNTSNEFTLALGAGYELPLASNVMLDLTGAFNLISDANHLTLRAGVLFGL